MAASKLRYTDLLIRVSAYRQEPNAFPVEATIDGDGFCYGGTLTLDRDRLLRPVVYGHSFNRGEQIFLAARCVQGAGGNRQVLSPFFDQLTDGLVWRPRAANEPQVVARDRDRRCDDSRPASRGDRGRPGAVRCAPPEGSEVAAVEKPLQHVARDPGHVIAVVGV